MTNNQTQSVTTPTVVVKRISWEKMQRKRAQGLCFNYTERFTPGHKCQVPQLLILESFIQDEVGLTMETLNDEEIVLRETETMVEVREPEITMHALIGWDALRTMRVKVTIGVQEIIALVDSGSTHNFINDRIASTLRLPVKPTEPFTVRVANGERLTCNGKYEDVLVDLQGTEFKLEFFSLPLIGLDMVLAV